MIEELFKLVQKESQNEIIDNPAIPNEQNNAAVGLATESVYSGLQSTLANGGLKDVLETFGDQAPINNSNPVVNNISEDFMGNLMKKLGIDAGKASSIARSLIPSILGKLVSKTNDPNDHSFNINDIIGKLTGGSTNTDGVQIPDANKGGVGGLGGIDFGGILKNLTGGSLDKNQDGKVNLDDLSALVGETSSEQLKYENETKPKGGIFDLINSLTGK